MPSDIPSRRNCQHRHSWRRRIFPNPKEPLVINVVDVAGDLQLSKGALEKFAETYPDLVSKFVYTQAPAPELAGKLKAQQAANRLDIDFLLTGNDALAAGPVDAGSGVFGALDEVSAADFEASWRVNALGLFLVPKEVVPAMKTAGSGAIIVIGATASRHSGACAKRLRDNSGRTASTWH